MTKYTLDGQGMGGINKNYTVILYLAQTLLKISLRYYLAYYKKYYSQIEFTEAVIAIFVSLGSRHKQQLAKTRSQITDSGTLSAVKLIHVVRVQIIKTLLQFRLIFVFIYPISLAFKDTQSQPF